jgi:nucleoside-diphosphate-sugar epimerase
MYLCADIDELTKDTGFVPEYSFEDGIKETVEWYRKEYLK